MNDVPLLSGKVIFLTGASRGIGRAVATRLASEDVRLALCGRDEAALKTLADEIAKSGAPAPFVASFDLANPDAVLRFYRDAKKALGTPDVLINNAGYNSRKAPLTEVSLQEFDALLAVNLRAPFLLSQAALTDMAEQRGGHIISVLSTVCHLAMETMGAYTIAKKGLEGLTGVLRKEARALGVRVSAIYPGGTDTEFRPKQRPDYMKPESVAEAVYAVLSLPEDLVVHDITFRPMVESNF